MKKVFKVLLFIILLIPFCVNAKEVTINGKIHGDGSYDVFTSVIETEDSYIAVSNSYSNEVYGIPSLGGSDIRIFKYKNGTLDVEWQKIFGGSYGDSVYDMAKVEDGFIIVGDSNSTDIEGITNNGRSDAIIVKFNNNGEVLFKNSWGGSSRDYFNEINNTKDNGFIVVGHTESTDIDITGAIIIKYDENGNIVWQTGYTNNYVDAEEFCDVIEVDDGYIAVGGLHSYNSDVFENKGMGEGLIVKYDLDGNLIWDKYYGGNGNEAFSQIIEVDGEYVVIGTSTSSDLDGLINKGTYDGYILKIDKNGNVLWQKNYGGNDWDFFDKIKKNNLGELVVVGESRSNDIEGITNNNYYNGIILKYDTNGNLLEQYSYGGNDNDSFSDIIFTKNGYVVVGSAASTDLKDIPYAGGYEGALILEYTINYDLQKETDTIKNGTYDLKQVGQRAEISINPDNGYELDNIIVTDTKGNKLSYYEENGKYYVDLKDDIVVDVKYKQKSIINPNTTGLLMILEVLGLFSILTYLYLNFTKKKRNA